MGVELQSVNLAAVLFEFGASCRQLLLRSGVRSLLLTDCFEPTAGFTLGRLERTQIASATRQETLIIGASRVEASRLGGIKEKKVNCTAKYIVK